MEHPKDVGDRSTLAIMAGLFAFGYEVLIPFGENTRYDLAIDDGQRLARVQCKTGRLKNGGILFPTASTYAHHPNPKIRRRVYDGEVDFFAVFCPETTGIYLVPIEDVPTTCAATLRVDPARNSQMKGVRYAAQYEIGRVSVVDRRVVDNPSAADHLARPTEGPGVPSDG